MPYGYYISAEGAHAQSKRLDVIANNLANVDTVGFKRDLAIFQARYAEAIQRQEVMPGMGTVNDVGGGILVRETKTDFAPGPMKHTGNPKDLAIRGEGFFLVENDGEQLLTRAGNFQLNREGQLVTQQGYAVLNESAAPIFIDEQAGGPWQITDRGEIQQRGLRQQIAVVMPESLVSLKKVGHTMFRPEGPTEPVPLARRNVATGYLEASGVEPTRAMTAMIEASRAIEANVRIMQTHDQMVGGLIAKVLRV
jgi:flagellar basal-body rod protein FlgF/flagellar basal-body rod protein FlgG